LIFVGNVPRSVRSQKMGINKDQVDGRVKEAAGKVQEVAGRAVGSPTQELKGKVKKTIGSVQADYGDANERNKEDAKHQAKDSRP
jgi:uncharacterized protein YjbJ (UPF0337 family)